MIGAVGLAALVALAWHVRSPDRAGWWLSEPAAAAPLPAGVVSGHRPLMGTLFEVSVWAPGKEAEARRAIGAALDGAQRLERQISSWVAESETSALNRGAGGPAQPVSAALRTLLAISLEWSARTEGAFDVTGGPLYALWREARAAGEVPTPAAIARARRAVGYQKLRLVGDTARLLKPGMALDFGGVGKGFAADRMAEALREAGWRDFTIEAGGDVVVGGTRGGAPWTVGVRDPRRAGLLARFPASECAVATSGDYEAFVMVEGERHGHLLDPRTGRAARGVASATVVALRGADADALATALPVLGAERGLELVESLRGYEALLVSEGGARLSSGLRLEGERLSRVRPAWSAR